MSGMNGFDYCLALRSLPNSESIPILMITGLNQNQAIDRALAAGATDFITKPVQLTVLQERIERLLRGVPH